MILYTAWYTLSSKLSILLVSCLLLFKFIKRQQQSHKTKHLPYKQGVIGSSPIVPTKCGPVVQLVRTLACHARGRRFEPVPGRHFPFAFVAQLVEQRTENPRVVGSIPTEGTICGCSSSGRAPPCQGGGSGFEPRHPLHLEAEALKGSKRSVRRRRIQTVL